MLFMDVYSGKFCFLKAEDFLGWVIAHLTSLNLLHVNNKIYLVIICKKHDYKLIAMLERKVRDLVDSSTYSNTSVCVWCCVFACLCKDQTFCQNRYIDNLVLLMPY
jgi:hypothetical protein